MTIIFCFKVLTLQSKSEIKILKNKNSRKVRPAQEKKILFVAVAVLFSLILKKRNCTTNSCTKLISVANSSVT